MRWLIILISFALVSCSSIKPMEEQITVSGFDFTKYADQGFLITPEQYLGEYESIGMMNVTIWPSVSESAKASASGVTERQRWYIGPLNVDKAIDRIYQQAKDMGADGIMRFNVKSIEQFNGSLRIEGAEISGFAINRTDN